MIHCIHRWFSLLTGLAGRRGPHEWVGLLHSICGSWGRVFPGFESPPSQVEHPKGKALAQGDGHMTVPRPLPCRLVHVPLGLLLLF